MDTEPDLPNIAQSPRKPQRLFFVGVLLLIAALVCAVIYIRITSSCEPEPPLLKANAKQLEQTLVTAHLETPLPPGKSVLWCSTFQLVWNESCSAAGGDLHLKDEPAMVPILNKKTATEADVDASSCLVMSGPIEQGIVDEIQKRLDRRFGGRASPDLLRNVESQLPQEGFLAYAYLYRTLPFEYPFKRLEKPLTFGSSKVASFGLQKATSRMDDIHRIQQVAVLDYQDANDFVLELKPKDKTERIVLAKISPAETLHKTIENVRSRIASTKLNKMQQRMEPGESIIIPILNFDLQQAYEELYGTPILTPGPLQGMPIVLALQSIRFRLDERGAILKSEAINAAAKCAVLSKPREFIFDRPFLILLERRDAQMPYFALWVDNPEILTRWE